MVERTNLDRALHAPVGRGCLCPGGSASRMSSTPRRPSLAASARPALPALGWAELPLARPRFLRPGLRGRASPRLGLGRRSGRPRWSGAGRGLQRSEASPCPGNPSSHASPRWAELGWVFGAPWQAALLAPRTLLVPASLRAGVRLAGASGVRAARCAVARLDRGIASTEAQPRQHTHGFEDNIPTPADIWCPASPRQLQPRYTDTPVLPRYPVTRVSSACGITRYWDAHWLVPGYTAS